MGEVIPLRLDAIPPGERQWVECLCMLAGQSERAADFLARGLTRKRIAHELRSVNPNLRTGEAAADWLASIRGRAGTARAPLPLHPQPHGTRRRPDRSGSA